MEKYFKKNPKTFTALQGVLRENICRIAPCPAGTPALIGYDKEYAELRDLIKATAEGAESNSVIVIGPRGSGKSSLVAKVLGEQVLSLYPCLDDLLSSGVQLLVVKLNGLLQCDERTALQEICRQLKLDNVLEDRVLGSFAENLRFVLTALQRGDKRCVSVAFILEEFDLFAAHQNQTLLYSLFDIAQAGHAPLVVVGLTCRLDVTELLEKRVKSRFSHRQILCFNRINFDDYISLARRYLTLPDDFLDAVARQHWNAHVDALLAKPNVRNIFNQQFVYNKDVTLLKQLLLLPICRPNEERPHLSVEDFVESAKMLNQDGTTNVIMGLSVLELTLLVAMMHLTENFFDEGFNFEMLYLEYKKFTERRVHAQLFEKAIVFKAYEHLLGQELLMPVEHVSASAQLEYRLMHLLVDPSVLVECCKQYSDCPTDLQRWATNFF